MLGVRPSCWGIRLSCLISRSPPQSRQPSHHHVPHAQMWPLYVAQSQYSRSTNPPSTPPPVPDVDAAYARCGQHLSQLADAATVVFEHRRPLAHFLRNAENKPSLPITPTESLNRPSDMYGYIGEKEARDLARGLRQFDKMANRRLGQCMRERDIIRHLAERQDLAITSWPFGRLGKQCEGEEENWETVNKWLDEGARGNELRVWVQEAEALIVRTEEILNRTGVQTRGDQNCGGSEICRRRKVFEMDLQDRE